VKNEIIDIFKKRAEPLTISQLSYALKYQKSYVEDCLGMLPQINVRELSKTLKVYFVPQQAIAPPQIEIDFEAALNTEC
jgi:DNA-binding IclR family transcriptional regulator